MNPAFPEEPMLFSNICSAIPPADPDAVALRIKAKKKHRLSISQCSVPLFGDNNILP
jgi:hypothetical protein